MRYFNTDEILGDFLLGPITKDHLDEFCGAESKKGYGLTEEEIRSKFYEVVEVRRGFHKWARSLLIADYITKSKYEIDDIVIDEVLDEIFNECFNKNSNRYTISALDSADKCPVHIEVLPEFYTTKWVRA